MLATGPSGSARLPILTFDVITFRAAIVIVMHVPGACPDGMKRRYFGHNKGSIYKFYLKG
jgi:hypothetical protein